MAAFSHQSFVLDSAYLPNTISIRMPLDQVGDLSMTNVTSLLPFYYSPTNAIPELSSTDLRTHERSSSHDSGRNFQGSEEISKNQGSLEKKRKSTSQRSCSSSTQPNGAKEGKSRKQKKCSNGLKETEEEPLKANEVEKKACQEPPTGYIHVRARRGQATDSHSLAERVRREKISERMKLLQGLVPGCDKVTGKALMLDEIINYVQSLQNQVEVKKDHNMFLSMKLASANPMSYDFAVDVNDYMVQPQRLESMSPPMASVQQTCSHIQPTAFPADTTNNYPMLDTSATFLLHGQGPSASSSQDNGSFVMQVDDHRQKFLNQVEFRNMCNFQ